MKTPVNEEMLLDYFNGRASALQKQLIDEWIGDPVNEELFYKCLEKWELSHPQYVVDVASAIDRYREYVERKQSKGVQTDEPEPVEYMEQTRPAFGKWYWAASVSAIILLGWWFRPGLLNQTYSTDPGQVLSWTLDDGSKVTLNSNSELRVPRFSLRWALPWQKNREVFLTGEATFSVIHTKDDRRFIVKTPNDMNVVVLGTEFSVYSRTNRMQVVLNQGKVVLERPERKKTEAIVLKPGDVVTLEDEKIHRKHVENPEVFSAWKDKLFVFDATPLSEVARLLKDNYGFEVAIPDSTLARETISGSFKATNGDELLKSLSKAFDIQAIRRGKSVTFLARNTD